MERLPNIHPGEILRVDFLEPMGIFPYRLAKDIGVGWVRVADILSSKRDITPDTAIRLGLYFGIEPEFWLNLRSHYNLVEARQADLQEYQAIPRRQRWAKRRDGRLSSGGGNQPGAEAPG